MIDYVIGEQYELPSKGKVYDKEVNPHIKLRSMTTNEEMKRLSPHADRPNKAMAEIIDDCLIENPGISSYDLCVGDYQFLMYKLRIVTYGPEYPLICTCPFCKGNTEESINLEDLPLLEYNQEEIQKYSEFDLPITKKHIKIKMQTPKILDDIQVAVKDYKKRHKNIVGEPAFLFTLKYLIDTIDGQKLDPVALESFILNLPMADTNKIAQYGQKLLDSIGYTGDLEVTCDICGLVYTTPFRVTNQFFGPTYD